MGSQVATNVNRAKKRTTHSKPELCYVQALQEQQIIHQQINYSKGPPILLQYIVQEEQRTGWLNCFLKGTDISLSLSLFIFPVCLVCVFRSLCPTPSNHHHQLRWRRRHFAEIKLRCNSDKTNTDTHKHTHAHKSRNKGASDRLNQMLGNVQFIDT